MVIRWWEVLGNNNEDELAERGRLQHLNNIRR